MQALKVVGLTLGLGLFSMGAHAGWYCEAESYSASGWGSSSSRSTAVSRALHECAIRTPYDQTCYITGCSRTRSVGEDESGEVVGLDIDDRKSIIDSIDANSVLKEEAIQGEIK